MTTGAGVRTDASTGVTMSGSKRFWDGSSTTNLGIGPRVRKVAFVTVKAYSISLYVDEAGATAALQQAKPSSDEAVCQALVGAPCTKAFQLHLLRDITGAQFTDAMNEAIKPKMKGDTAPVDAFNAYFAGKQLPNGTNVVMLWRQPATLDVLTVPPGSAVDDFSQAAAGASIESALLCQSIFSSFVQTAGPTPEACKAWIASAKALAA